MRACVYGYLRARHVVHCVWLCGALRLVVLRGYDGRPQQHLWVQTGLVDGRPQYIYGRPQAHFMIDYGTWMADHAFDLPAAALLAASRSIDHGRSQVRLFNQQPQALVHGPDHCTTYG